MSVALQVLLLVVAIVVAVAGIGVALALRMASRPRAGRAHRRGARGGASERAGNVVPIGRVRPAVAGGAAAAAGVPAGPLDPAQAHAAKLAALQALLALGDAKAERDAATGKGTFADTQPVDDEYQTTQFVERDNPPSQLSLLNLDKAGGSRKRLG